MDVVDAYTLSRSSPPGLASRSVRRTRCRPVPQDNRKQKGVLPRIARTDRTRSRARIGRTAGGSARTTEGALQGK